MEELEIRRDVRQRCVLSHPIDAVFNKTFENTHVNMKINGNSIKNIRYGDATLVVASSLPALKYLMDLIVEHSLHLNTFNTKLVVF